jgi:hypothetical protein
VHDQSPVYGAPRHRSRKAFAAILIGGLGASAVLLTLGVLLPAAQAAAIASLITAGTGLVTLFFRLTRQTPARAIETRRNASCDALGHTCPTCGTAPLEVDATQDVAGHSNEDVHPERSAQTQRTTIDSE